MDMGGPSGSALARSTLERLKTRIVSGQWPVGGRIPTEPELVEMFGVGRSTVREAIRSLATLGMVETLTAKGTFVRSQTPAPSLLLNALSAYEPAELVGIRRALDVEAAQVAAVQASPRDVEELESVLAESRGEGRGDGSALRCSRFHGLIAHASGNHLLTDLHASVSAALDDSRIADAASADTLVADHEAILAAIRDGDVAEAAHLMAIHVDGALRAIHHEPIATELTSLSPRFRSAS